jgi:U4/U6.U5 tri-snRNP-associated protein 3
VHTIPHTELLIGNSKPETSNVPTLPNLDPDAPEEGEEEAMDVNNEDSAVMSMMGMASFGSTKVSSSLRIGPDVDKHFQGKHVEGNQEGAVNLKKMRTWRQYMNRWVA